MTTTAVQLILSATVRVRRAPPGRRKCSFLTDATIRIGARALAFLTLGGAHTARTALMEFRRLPARWEPQPGFSPEDVVFYAQA